MSLVVADIGDPRRLGKCCLAGVYGGGDRQSSDEVNCEDARRAFAGGLGLGVFGKSDESMARASEEPAAHSSLRVVLACSKKAEANSYKHMVQK